MTTLLSPIPIDYTELSQSKSIGGSIQFLNVTTPLSIRFIDTFELNLSMYVILGKYIYEQYVGTTIFSIIVTFADLTTEVIWSYQVHDRIVGFTLAQSFFDLQTYRDVINITLIANNEITLNQHDFIIWGGYMKIIQEVTPTFIGGNIHVTNLMPVSMTLNWGQTNYDYAIVNWGDGVTNGVYTNIYINYVKIAPTSSNALLIYWGTGNYNTINISYNNQYIAKDITSAYQYQVTDLEPNTTYTYQLVPSSYIGVSGEINVISSVTLPTIGPSSYSNIDPNTAAITWQGGNYSNIQIFDNFYGTDQISSNQYSNISSSNQSYIYIANGLISNILYNFTLIPYNSSNISSSATYQPSTSVSFVTLATVGTAFASPAFIKYNSANIQWLIGSYTSVTLVSSDGTINIPGIYNNNITINGLNANTYYTFYVIPVNSVGVQNINGLQAVSFRTLGYLNYINSTNILSKSVLLTWNPPIYNGISGFINYTYSNINISGNNSNYIDIPGTQYNINALTPNTIYTYYAYPNNNCNIANTIEPPSTTFNTLAVIDSPTILQITKNSINLSWNSAKSAYSIINTAPSINGLPNSGQNSYNIQQLTANTNYTITIIPYNQQNQANYNTNEIITQKLLTLGNITTLSSCNITTNTAYIYWSGAYSNVNILGYSQNFTVSLTPLSIPVYSTSNYPRNSSNIQNLIPNMFYTFYVYPINSSNVINKQDIYYTTYTTQATVSNVSMSNINTTSFTVKWPTSYNQNTGPFISSNSYYQNMNVMWTSNSVFVGSNTVTTSPAMPPSPPASLPASLSYDIYGLAINTLYTIAITPINTAGIANSLATLTTSTVTLATLDSFNYIYDSASVTITWTGIMSYMNIQYYQTYNPSFATVSIPPITIGNGNNVQISQTTTYIINSLSPNIYYTFILTPANSASIANTTATRQFIFNTLATSISFTSNIVTESLIELTWNKGNANSINISQFNPVTQTTTTILTNYNQDVKYDVTSSAFGLIPNKVYVYTLFPVNNAGYPNTISTLSITTATLAVVSDISISAYTSSNANITWNSSISYNTINLYWSDMSLSTGSNLNIYTNSTTATQLIPNDTYTFTAIPINISNIANPNKSKTLSPPLNTLAVIDNVLFSKVKSKEIDLAFIGTKYNTANIYWTSTSNHPGNPGYNYNSLAGSITPAIPVNGTYPITNLLPNSLCTFNIIPYNNTSVANTINQINVSSYTLATIDTNTFQLQPLSSQTIGISWITNANYVNIYTTQTTNQLYLGVTTSNTQTSSPQSLVINYPSMTPNTNYTVSITPYNNSGASNNNTNDGGTITQNIYTLATINSANTCNIEITTTDVYFTGIFSTVNIIVNNITNPNTHFIIPNISSSPYTISSGLSTNQIYRLTLVPVNANGVQNNVTLDGGNYILPQINTYATVGSLSILENTGSNIIISWGSGSYSSINVFKNLQYTSNISALTSPDSSTYYNYTSLTPNRQYSFDVYALNIFGQSNVNFDGNYSQSVKNFTTYTAATLASLTADILSPTNARINLGSPGDFYNNYKYVTVVVKNSQTGIPIQQSPIYINYPSTTNPLNNLTPNTTYTMNATPYNNNYNNDIPMIAVTTATFTTPPIINNAYTTNILNSSARLNWTSINKYTSVSVQLIQTDTNTSIQSPQILSYQDIQYINYINLYPNTTYRYVITPYNTNNSVVPVQQSGPVYSGTFATWSAISPLSINYYNASVVNFSWNYTGGGTSPSFFYNNVKINDTTPSSNIVLNAYTSNSSYSASNLIPNTAYNISLLSYSSCNIPNYSNVQVASINELGTIGDLTIASVASNNAIISWNAGLYSSINAQLIKVSNGNIINTQTQIKNTLYSVNSLNANTLYNATITPVNVLGVANPANASNIQFTTLPTNVLFNLYSTDSNITVAWTNSVEYSYIVVSSNSSYYNTVTQTPDIINNLHPNTNYLINMIPYNALNIAGAGNSSSIYTWGITSNITFGTVTQSSINVITNNGIYNTIRIAWSDANGSYTTQGLSAKSNVIGGLIANTPYTFRITPYNNAIPTYAGSAVTSSTMYTLSSVTNFYTTNVAIFSCILYINGLYTSYILNINDSLNNTLSYSGTSNYYIVPPVLNENTLYTLNVIPINYYGLSNLTVPSIQMTTLSRVTNVQYVPYKNAITLQWNNSPGINYVNILKNGNQIYTNLQGYTSITLGMGMSGADPLLSPNTTYTFQIVPVNSAMALNYSGGGITSNLATLADISSISSQNIATNSVKILWNSSATFMNLVYASTNITLNYGSTSNVSLSNLLPNTSYIFHLYPINCSNVTNTVDSYSTSITTLATISTASLSNYTDTTATVAWNTQPVSNIYTSVTLINTSSPQPQPPTPTSNIGITDTQYTINNLIANTQYNISVLCYNSQNIETYSLRQNIPSFVTLPTLTNISLSSGAAFLSSNLTVNWSGSNSSVDINIYDINNINVFSRLNIISSYLGSNYTVTSKLIPNSFYTISVTPYNSVNIPNTTQIQSINTTTLAGKAGISTVYTTASNAAFYLIGGLYTSNIIQVSTQQNPSAILQSITFPSSNILVNNLNANTPYIFSVFPINSVAVTNIYEYNSINLITKSKVSLATNSITNLTNNSLTVRWTLGPTDSYDYVIVSWYLGSGGNGAPLGTSPQINLGGGIGTTGSYTLSGLLDNTLYNIVVTPYTYSVGIGMPVNVYVTTLATVNVAISSITSSNISIVNSGTYSYNSISWSANGTTNIQNNYYPTLFTGASNLAPNVQYTFTVIPYNSVDVANTVNTYVIYITTLATMGNSSNYNVLSTTLTETWTQSNATQVSVGWAFSNNSTSNIATLYHISYPPQNITNLIPNTNYIFTVIPYNSASPSQCNISSVSYNTVNTLAYIDNIYFTNITSSGCLVNWMSSNTFTSVDLSYALFNTPQIPIITSNIPYNVSTSYQANNLIQNATYIFTLVPYNSNNIPNYIEKTSVSFVAPSIITNVSLLGKTASNIDIGWTGIYSSVNIQWSSNSIPIGSANQISGANTLSGNHNFPIINSLLPNTNYTITVIPTNTNNILGFSSSLTTYTLAAINNLNSVSTGTTVTLSWSDSTYNFIKIKFNGNTYINSNQYNQDYTAYTFKGLVPDTNYSFQLIPYNNQLPLNDVGYTYPLNVLTLGTYQFTSFNFITNSTVGANALPLSSLLNLPSYTTASWTTANISYYNILGTTITGYQYITLPASGYYSIIVAGAAGGSNLALSQQNGYGAIITATFYFDTSVDNLIIVPGLAGTSTNNVSLAAGGGGASALFRVRPPANPTPLMVAAGGGGTGTLINSSSNAYTTLVNETTTSLYIGTNNTAGAAACVNRPLGTTANGFPQPILYGSSLYTGLGGTGGIPGGFGGGASGGASAGTSRSGGGGGSWVGSANTPTNSGGYGGAANMAVSYSSNCSFVGYNNGNGYISISTILYPILPVSVITPITNITWGAVTIKWGAYDPNAILYVNVAWTGDVNTGYDSGQSNVYYGTNALVLTTLKYSPSIPYNYTFSITPYDLLYSAGTPLTGISANSSATNPFASSVTLPITGQLSASNVFGLTSNLTATNVYLTFNPLASSVSNVVVSWGDINGSYTFNSLYPVNTYKISNLIPNTNYSISLTPYDIYYRPGLTYTANIVSAYLLTNVNAVVASYSNATISWAPVYAYSNVYVTSVPATTGQLFSTSPATFTGLAPNTSYKFIVATSNVTNIDTVDQLTTGTITTYPRGTLGTPSGLANTYNSANITYQYTNYPPDTTNAIISLYNGTAPFTLVGTTAFTLSAPPVVTIAIPASNISLPYYVTVSVGTTLYGPPTISAQSASFNSIAQGTLIQVAGLLNTYNTVNISYSYSNYPVGTTVGLGISNYATNTVISGTTPATFTLASSPTPITVSGIPGNTSNGPVQYYASLSIPSGTYGPLATIQSSPFNSLPQGALTQLTGTSNTYNTISISYSYSNYPDGTTATLGISNYPANTILSATTSPSTITFTSPPTPIIVSGIPPNTSNIPVQYYATLTVPTGTYAPVTTIQSSPFSSLPQGVLTQLSGMSNTYNSVNISYSYSNYPVGTNASLNIYNSPANTLIAGTTPSTFTFTSPPTPITVTGIPGNTSNWPVQYYAIASVANGTYGPTMSLQSSNFNSLPQGALTTPYALATSYSNVSIKYSYSNYPVGTSASLNIYNYPANTLISGTTPSTFTLGTTSSPIIVSGIPGNTSNWPVQYYATLSVSPSIYGPATTVQTSNYNSIPQGTLLPPVITAITYNTASLLYAYSNYPIGTTAGLSVSNYATNTIVYGTAPTSLTFINSPTPITITGIPANTSNWPVQYYATLSVPSSIYGPLTTIQSSNFNSIPQGALLQPSGISTAYNTASITYAYSNYPVGTIAGLGISNYATHTVVTGTSPATFTLATTPSTISVTGIPGNTSNYPVRYYATIYVASSIYGPLTVSPQSVAFDSIPQGALIINSVVVNTYMSASVIYSYSNYTIIPQATLSLYNVASPSTPVSTSSALSLSSGSPYSLAIPANTTLTAYYTTLSVTAGDGGIYGPSITQSSIFNSIPLGALGTPTGTASTYNSLSIAYTYTNYPVGTSATLNIYNYPANTLISATSPATFTLGTTSSPITVTGLFPSTLTVQYYATISVPAGNYGPLTTSAQSSIFNSIAQGGLGTPTTSSITYNSVNVNWTYTNYPTNTSATIYISTSASTNNSVASQAITLGQTTQPAIITGLAASTPYYAIVSVLAGTYGPLTNVASSVFNTIARGTLGTPTGTASTYNSLSIAYTYTNYPVGTSATLNIYNYPANTLISGTSPATFTLGTTSSPITVTGLSPSTSTTVQQYYATISVPAGNYGPLTTSTQSSIFNSIAQGALGTPTTSSITYNSVNVNWTYTNYPTNTSATIYISTSTSTNNSVALQAITLGQTQPATITGLAASTTYYAIVSVPAGTYGPLTNGVSSVFNTIQNLSDGLSWTMYNGYFNDDIGFFNTASVLNNGTSYDFTSINTSVSNTYNSGYPNNGNTFSIQYYGTFYVNITGYWAFAITSDDASYCWIGPYADTGYNTGNAFLNDGNLHGMQTASSTYYMTAGQYYSIRMLFGQNGGGYGFSFSFTPPSGTQTYIGNGYYYTYYSALALTSYRLYLSPSFTSPSSYAGTTPTFSSTYITFNSGSNQYIDFGSNYFNLGTLGFSLKVKILWTGYNNWSRVIDFNSGSGGNQDMFLTLPGFGSTLRFQYKENNAEQQINYAGPMNLNQIYTIAAVYNPNTGGTNGQLDLWVNGVNVATSTSMSYKGSDKTYSYTYIGRSSYNGDAYLGAQIYKLIIYNRALTQGEILLPM